jgi:hypothetical protein
MKSFSFVSGNSADSSRGMTLVVDRSRLPAQMNLGLWLDDDGKAFPGLPRTVPASPAGSVGEVEFVDPARVKIKVAGLDVIVKIAAGTRIELSPKRALGEIKVTGATVTTRGTRRFAQLVSPKSQIEIDKAPSAVHVFTLDAEKPPGAAPGATYRVDVAQNNSAGALVGGVTVIFKFD